MQTLLYSSSFDFFLSKATMKRGLKYVITLFQLAQKRLKVVFLEIFEFRTEKSKNLVKKFQNWRNFLHYVKDQRHQQNIINSSKIVVNFIVLLPTLKK